MKKIDWTLVPEAQGGSRLPAGGYVIRITKVEDMPSKEYLWIEYDIAEGAYTGQYDDDYSARNPYVHRFARSYKETAQPFFKKFLTALEESNVGKFYVDRWEVNCDESALVGLLVGAVFGDERYTNNRGEDKTRLTLSRIVPADEIRSNDYSIPDVLDNRIDNGRPEPGAAVIDDSIPF